MAKRGRQTKRTYWQTKDGGVHFSVVGGAGRFWKEFSVFSAETLDDLRVGDGRFEFSYQTKEEAIAHVKERIERLERGITLYNQFKPE